MWQTLSRHVLEMYSVRPCPAPPSTRREGYGPPQERISYSAPWRSARGGPPLIIVCRQCSGSTRLGEAEPLESVERVGELATARRCLARLGAARSAVVVPLRDTDVQILAPERSHFCKELPYQRRSRKTMLNFRQFRFVRSRDANCQRIARAFLL